MRVMRAAGHVGHVALEVDRGVGRVVRLIEVMITARAV